MCKYVEIYVEPRGCMYVSMYVYMCKYVEIYVEIYVETRGGGGGGASACGGMHEMNEDSAELASIRAMLLR
jgi:hypothetical protein